MMYVDVHLDVVECIEVKTYEDATGFVRIVLSQSEVNGSPVGPEVNLLVDLHDIYRLEQALIDARNKLLALQGQGGEQ